MHGFFDAQKVVYCMQRVTQMYWTGSPKTVLGFLILTILSAAAIIGQNAVWSVLVQIMTHISSASISSETYILLGAVLVFYFARPFINSMMGFLDFRTWTLGDILFEKSVAEKYIELDIAQREDPKLNDIFTKVRDTGEYRFKNIFHTEFLILKEVLVMIFSSAVIGFGNVWVALAVIISIIPVMIVNLKFATQEWGIHGSKAETRRQFWNLQSLIREHPSAREIKLFQSGPALLGKMLTLLNSFFGELRKKESRKLKYTFGAIMIEQAALIGAIAYFIIETLHGKYDPGIAVFYISSLFTLQSSFDECFTRISLQYENGLFLQDFFSFLDLETRQQQTTGQYELAPDEPMHIVFDNVSFRYPGTDTWVLRNISFEIRPGQKIALVGINGAGKTTLTKLLCRFYDPTEGRITINGYDARDISFESYYNKLAALFQDYANYRFRVTEAIEIGRSDAQHSDEAVQIAAQKAEAHEFIQKWNKGYDSILGREFENGVEPSVGQWQKLGLARTIYRNPNLMILDEPTSSIDAEAEMKIFENVLNIGAKTSVLLISHRFSTVRQADTILVLEGSQLREHGSHEALIAQNGLYARLFHLQAAGYAE